MREQHAEHIAKQLASGISGVMRELNDSLVVEAIVTLKDIEGNTLNVMLDGTYPQTRTTVRFNKNVVSRWLNYFDQES
jgi:hypothetical protein